MFETILYPTDFSDVAQKALPYIKSLKHAGSTKVVLLHVLNERRIECMTRGVAWWAGKDVQSFLKEVQLDLEKQAWDQLISLESELKAVGFDVHLIIEQGIPHAKILEVAQKEDVSAIVLGSHGRSNLAEMLLGSVSEHVIRQSKTPVLVIKRD